MYFKTRFEYVMVTLYLGMQARSLSPVVTGLGLEQEQSLETIRLYSIIALLALIVLKICKISAMKFRSHFVLFPLLRLLNITFFYAISTIFPDFEGSIVEFGLTEGVGYLLFYVMINNGLYFIVDPDGPYGIGVKDIILKGKRKTPRISIYYPIDKTEYDNKVDDPNETLGLLEEGEEGIKGGCRGVSSLPGSSDAHPLILSLFSENPEKYKPVVEDLQYSRIRAIVSSELHKDFKNGGIKLTPVIISPGWGGSKNLFTIISRYLASYGWIVFAITHTDGSCEYTCDYNQSPPKSTIFNFLDAKTNTDDHGRKYKNREEYFSLSVDNRVKDIETLYEYILECEFNQYLDINKLVMYGHSLGGITGLEASRTLKTQSGEAKIKACVALDPYYMGRLSHIMTTDSYKVEQPLLVVSSETFKDSPIVWDYYDNKETNERFMKSCKTVNDKVHDITWENTGHMSQMDTSITAPVIVRLLNFMGPISEAVEKAHEICKMVLEFIDSQEMLPVKLPSK